MHLKILGVKPMDLRLKDRVAFLTGATNEIGRAVCLELVNEGAKIAFSDINVEKGEDLAHEIAGIGGEAVFLKTDVRNYEEVKANVMKAKDHFGEVDIMVYMAGVVRIMRFVESTPDSWKETVDVFLYGMLNTTHAVLPLMIENRYGKIVSFIGDSSRIGESGLSLPAASRAGQMALIKSVAKEVGRYNITLNCISLGVVETSHYPAGHIDKYRERIIKNYPLGRLGKPEDVIPLTLLLCSDLSNWITGQIISVNGGYSMV
jgi:NAD(P)-dependent dehydrogenase (short-subunit alcohol dehydrogenase family)